MASYPPLQVVRLFPDAKLPVRSNPDDSGLDVFVYQFEALYCRDVAEATRTLRPNRTNGFSGDPHDIQTFCLRTNERVLVNCGFSATVGEGYEIQMRPRSGNALKRGLTILNSPGTIDSSYRGLIGAIVVNLGLEAQEISIGDKIAQIVVAPVILSEVVEVKRLGETKRGAGGFGHTGSK